MPEATFLWHPISLLCSWYVIIACMRRFDILLMFNAEEESDACDPFVYDPLMFTPSSSAPSSKPPTPSGGSFLCLADRDKVSEQPACAPFDLFPSSTRVSRAVSRLQPSRSSLSPGDTRIRVLFSVASTALASNVALENGEAETQKALVGGCLPFSDIFAPFGFRRLSKSRGDRRFWQASGT